MTLTSNPQSFTLITHKNSTSIIIGSVRIGLPKTSPWVKLKAVRESEKQAETYNPESLVIKEHADVKEAPILYLVYNSAYQISAYKCVHKSTSTFQAAFYAVHGYSLRRIGVSNDKTNWRNRVITLTDMKFLFCGI